MFEETTNSLRFPGNQEQYHGLLIPRSNSDSLQSSLDSTGLDLTMPYTNCEEFQEIRRDALDINDRLKKVATGARFYHSPADDNLLRQSSFYPFVKMTRVKKQTAKRSFGAQLKKDLRVASRRRQLQLQRYVSFLGQR